MQLGLDKISNPQTSSNLFDVLEQVKKDLMEMDIKLTIDKCGDVVISYNKTSSLFM